MKIASSVGKALILALCTVSVPACNQGGTSTNQAASAASDAQLEWTRKAEKQLREAIGQAPANGLRPDLFLKGELPKDDAQRYAVLTQAALRYAEALAHGYTDPAKVNAIYLIPRARGDVRAGLTQALQNGNVGEWLASLPPQTAEYRALGQAHLRYVKLAGQVNFQPVPEGRPIRPGSQDRRIPAAAAALSVYGYLPSQPANAPLPRRYSGPLVAGVKALQAEYGLKPDGVIAGDTLEALNAGPSARARQLAVAMERLRWLQRNPPATRIDVNTAAAFLNYWRDGQPVTQRRVVTGQPGWETPQIQAPILQLVANPAWRLPDSIVADELAKKGPSFFAESGIVMKDGRYIQPPGPKNALGLVKFDMQDKQQIYLHDTPAKALFALADRHRSHGCVRVENAIQFAELLASQDGVLDHFQEALAGGEEKWVKLKTAIPVRLLYHTAFFDGQRVQFRPDVYGWDDEVAGALGFVRGQPHKQYQPRGEDIGP